MAKMMAKHYPYCASPTERRGDAPDAWDNSHFVQKLIDQISADTSVQATTALELLAKESKLKSYREYILHALANHQTKRRDAQYRQPTWRATIASLANGKPANAADLHALVHAHLDDIVAEIDGTNVDTYKDFWSEDSKGRLTTPKNEESCRDALVRLLRLRLQPYGVIVEPEGHMAKDKRADIAIFLDQSKAVIELKRDVHPKIWSAATTQLDRFYTRDPQCSGYGVYGVFWFGQGRAGEMRKPPKNERPGSATEMKELLEDLLPVPRRHHLAVVAFDVSGKSPTVKKCKKPRKPKEKS